MEHAELGGDDAEGVAVGFGVGDGRMADDTAAAGPVHHIHGFAKLVFQQLGDDTPCGVGPAARTPGHDQGDRALGIGCLCGGQSDQGHGRRGNRYQGAFQKRSLHHLPKPPLLCFRVFRRGLSVRMDSCCRLTASPPGCRPTPRPRRRSRSPGPSAHRVSPSSGPRWRPASARADKGPGIPGWSARISRRPAGCPRTWRSTWAGSFHAAPWLLHGRRPARHPTVRRRRPGWRPGSRRWSRRHPAHRTDRAARRRH